MLAVTSIRDRVADRYLGLELNVNDAVACRGFVNALDAVRNDRSNLLSTNVEDFELWLLCYFDEDCGYFYYENPDDDGALPRMLMRGSTAIKMLDNHISLADAQGFEPTGSIAYPQMFDPDLIPVNIPSDDEFPFHPAEFDEN